MDTVGGGPLHCRGFDPAYAGCGMSARQMRWTNLRQTRCAPSPRHKRVYARGAGRGLGEGQFWCPSPERDCSWSLEPSPRTRTRACPSSAFEVAEVG
jgi:hypothetical protein